MTFEIAPNETEIQAIWDDARLYCFGLNINGKFGWRLPTIEELDWIHQSQNDFKKDWYWSSTEDNGHGSWAQWMCGTGGQASFYKSLGTCYVRAIRDIKAN